MVDKTPGDRKLSVPNKTLTLKPRVETGTVKQSFSHGRTKQVVVEKRGKRRIGGDAPATETHAPEPVVAKVAPAKAPLARPAAPTAAPRSASGGVLRTLTEDERSARARNGAGGRRSPHAAPARRDWSRRSVGPPTPAAGPRKNATGRTRKP